MTLLEWSPFAHGSVWSGTISIVCTARRHYYVDTAWFLLGLIIKTVVVLINNSPGISGMSLLSAFQTETNFLCQEKR